MSKKEGKSRHFLVLTGLDVLEMEHFCFSTFWKLGQPETGADVVLYSFAKNDKKSVAI